MTDEEPAPIEEPLPEEDAPPAEIAEETLADAVPEVSTEGTAENAFIASPEDAPEAAPPEDSAPGDEIVLAQDQGDQPAETADSPQQEEIAQETDAIDVQREEEDSIKDDERPSQEDEGGKVERRVSVKAKTIEDNFFEEMGRSKSVLEVLKDSTIDIQTKKEILEKKKQKVLGSVISIRRGDPTFFDRQKIPKFQNSYKLESDRPFNYEKVETILQEVMEDALQDLSYDPDKCAKQAKWASSAIRAKVKEQEYERYKIICYVSIGEKLCQDVLTMLRFLWDPERDRYAIYVHENFTLYGIALCFGIYYE